MLNTPIPKFKYNLTDYPNLEERAIDMVIPERYGTKLSITPVCIDTTAMTYKLAKRGIKAIDEIRTDELILAVGDDYSVDLANAQFTLLVTPYLEPNTEYYIVFEGDWTINGADYLEIFGWNDEYALGSAYEIDGGDSWTPITQDIAFQIYGRAEIDGDVELKFNQTAGDPDGTFAETKLRDHADRTKIAMKFKTIDNGEGFWIDKIIPSGLKTAGFPEDKFIRVTVYSDQGVTQVGIPTNFLSCNWMGDNNNVWSLSIPQRGVPSKLSVDMRGYHDGGLLLDQVDDILQDVCVNVLGVPNSLLDNAAFGDLGTARTQTINPQIDREITFGNFVEKLERGQLFKFMPTLAGLFSPRVYESGEPGGTPHLYDEDFISFKCRRNLDSVKKTYIIEYNEDPTNQQYEESEISSAIAEYLYQNEEILRVETYLKDEADALQLATDYRGLLQYPQREITFEVKSYLFDKIPTEKVKITRLRGDNTNGVFEAVLFRIMKLIKKQSSGTVICTAILDSQTY